MVSQLFKLILLLDPESLVNIRVAGEISDSWRFAGDTFVGVWVIISDIH